MLDTLLESRALAERTTAGSAASLIAHVTLIALAVMATHRTAAAALDPEPEVVRLFVPRDPPPAPAEPPRVHTDAPPPPRGFQILVAPVEIPTVLPNIDLSRPITNDADHTRRNGVPGGTADGDTTSRRQPRRDATLYEFQVEKPAALVPGFGTPAYPDALRESGVEGEVLVAFVIDTTGRADMSTLKVMRSAHPLFTDAVRAALPRMRFLPAEVGGKKVKQFAQMPFAFRLR